MPLRILHISTRLILGGSQENTVLSCEGQARLGHRVHLAFGPIYGPEGSLLDRIKHFNHRCRTGEERTAQDGAVCEIVTHTVPHLVRDLSPRADIRCYYELRELVRRVSPDVVHTHSSKAGIIGRCAAFRPGSAHAFPLASRAPISYADDAKHSKQPTSSLISPPLESFRRGPDPKVIHTIHGPPFMPVEGPFSRRLKTRLTNAIYTLAERHAARRCHTIVSVADAMTRLFLSKRIGRPEQYVTVYSGMETRTFLNPLPGESPERTRSELGIGPEDFVVGTVARLAEHKGHDDLLDGLAADLRANPTWKLLWIGDGWWRQRLTDKARALGLTIHEADREPATPPQGFTPRLAGSDSPAHPSAAANIILTGLVPPHEVPPLLRAMDVLAHPSYREGLPRTVPQALLCGVCPVATDVDGSGEVCRELETGRLVPPADPQRLRDAILWCSQNPLARRALALRGQSECIERFSTHRMVQDLEQVYNGRPLSACSH